MRSYQYFDFLRNNGNEVFVSPLFNDEYLKALYGNNKKSIFNVFKCYLKRIVMLFTVFKYGVLVIEKELFPYFPSVFERILKFFKIKFIVDYDDAIFHNYDKSNNFLMRLFLKNKIDNVMKNSTCVIAGNSYLKERAQKAGAKRIENIPTVIDLERYKIRNISPNKRMIIGWVGTQSTYEKHLLSIKEVILKILENDNIDFHVIGVNPSDKIEGIKYIDWTEKNEVEEIFKFDVGIMPLLDSDWERGKCSYKLIQYMACSKPVIASPIGMNNEVINSANGFLVNTTEEWLERLNFYYLNPSLREKHGKEGRKIVEEKYTLQVTQIKYNNIIKSIQ